MKSPAAKTWPKFIPDSAACWEIPKMMQRIFKGSSQKWCLYAGSKWFLETHHSFRSAFALQVMTWKDCNCFISWPLMSGCIHASFLLPQRNLFQSITYCSVDRCFHLGKLTTSMFILIGFDDNYTMQRSIVLPRYSLPGISRYPQLSSVQKSSVIPLNPGWLRLLRTSFPHSNGLWRHPQSIKGRKNPPTNHQLTGVDRSHYPLVN